MKSEITFIYFLYLEKGETEQRERWSEYDESKIIDSLVSHTQHANICYLCMHTKELEKDEKDITNGLFFVALTSKRLASEINLKSYDYINRNKIVS